MERRTQPGPRRLIIYIAVVTTAVCLGLGGRAVAGGAAALAGAQELLALSRVGSSGVNRVSVLRALQSSGDSANINAFLRAVESPEGIAELGQVSPELAQLIVTTRQLQSASLALPSAAQTGAKARLVGAECSSTSTSCATRSLTMLHALSETPLIGRISPVKVATTPRSPTQSLLPAGYLQEQVYAVGDHRLIIEDFVWPDGSPRKSVGAIVDPAGRDFFFFGKRDIPAEGRGLWQLEPVEGGGSTVVDGHAVPDLWRGQKTIDGQTWTLQVRASQMEVETRIDGRVLPLARGRYQGADGAPLTDFRESGHVASTKLRHALGPQVDEEFVALPHLLSARLQAEFNSGRTPIPAAGRYEEAIYSRSGKIEMPVHVEHTPLQQRSITWDAAGGYNNGRTRVTLDGTTRIYDSDGALRMELTYEQGVLRQLRTEDGMGSWEIAFNEAGVPHGQAFHTDPDGQTAGFVRYNNGVALEAENYTQSGDIIVSMTNDGGMKIYRNPRTEQVEVQYPDGQLIRYPNEATAKQAIEAYPLVLQIEAARAAP